MRVTSIQKRTEIEFFIKAIISMILGLFITKMMGYPNVVTIPITAYLVFWVNRGVRGTIEYFFFRLRIQLIFIIVDVAVWRLTAYLFPDFGGWKKMVLLCCIFIPFWLQIYFRFKLMPLTLTAIFSTQILFAGLSASGDYWVRRLLWTVVGQILGACVAVLIPGPGKLKLVLEESRKIAREGIGELCRMAEEGRWILSPAFKQKSVQIRQDLQSMKSYLAVVQKDHTQPQKLPQSLVPEALCTFKYREHSKDLPLIRESIRAAEALVDLLDCIQAEGGGAAGLRGEVAGLAEKTARSHGMLLGDNKGTEGQEGKAGRAGLLPQSEKEIMILEALLHYRSCVDRLQTAGGN